MLAILDQYATREFTLSHFSGKLPASKQNTLMQQ